MQKGRCMGSKIIIELFVCDKSLAVISKYGINPAEVAIEAILEAIKTKQQIEDHLTGCNLVLENTALKSLLQDSLRENERIRSFQHMPGVIQRMEYLEKRKPITNMVIRV